ncbi:MAG: helix-turn-helix domain-containing protein [Deltaproteobacteria bacterium]|nr:helix-turn-helix domain-containing protein [Deltaproteobacteria bacterium]
MRTLEKDRPNPKDVAAWLDRPVSTIYCWIRRKMIPHTRLGPRSVMFDRETLIRWEKARQVAIGD